MCGRYVLSLLSLTFSSTGLAATPQRYGQVRNVLRENGMPAHEYFDDDEEEGDVNDGDDTSAGTGGDYRHTQDEDNAYQPSYNFAPGYLGVVCRAIPSENKMQNIQGQRAKHAGQDKASSEGTAPSTEDPSFELQLQVMKWGLIPSWTKRRPDYATTLKTINCRADSLSTGTGIWAALRGRKRCVVIAQGFYEWLKVGPKERVPYYIRRHDGRPLLFAGLWDRVIVDDDDKDEASGGDVNRKRKKKLYTYTIITTDSNEQLRFLHDRMPVIFDFNSPELRMWLDPKRNEWSRELQSLLRPWPYKGSGDGDDSGSFLDVDVVSKEVNKVGHNSPSLILPVASRDNKSNIANFFASGNKEQKQKDKPPKQLDKATVKTKADPKAKAGDLEASELVVSPHSTHVTGSKRSASEHAVEESQAAEITGLRGPNETELGDAEHATPKKRKTEDKTSTSETKRPGKGFISATSNASGRAKASPSKGKGNRGAAVGSGPKITSFFAPKDGS